MDIVRVNIEKAYYKGARHYVLAIKTRYEYKPLLRINLTPISKSDRIIILNVIHQFAPNATMNELAEQMRNGDFPVA